MMNTSEVLLQTDKGKIRKNSKFEYRNPKQIQMTKILIIKTNKLFHRESNYYAVWNFEHLNLDIVSSFEFRISNLKSVGLNFRIKI